MEKIKKVVDRVNLLDDFADKVAKKVYKKMPYTEWRDLAHRSEKDLMIIRLAFQCKFQLFVLKNGCVSDKVGECSEDDYSLGKYLFDNWDRFTPAKGGLLDMLNGTTYTYDTSTVISSGSGFDNYATTGVIGNTTTAIGYDPYSSSITLQSSLVDEDKCRKIAKEEIEKDKNKNEETSKMNTNDLFHFEFGPVSSNIFRMSPYGLAVRTEKNGWIAYNAKTGDLMDVEVLNFDISKMIYKMPVALSAIAPGDILMHGGKPVFVRDIGTGTMAGPTVNVIDYATASVMDILPVKSPFGFNFFTKVCPLIDMSGMTANPDNPFGNMLPFLMLNGENNDFDPTLLFLAGGMNNMDFSKNPMMLYFLMNRKDTGDLLPFMLMMNGGNFGMAPISAPTPAPVTTLK